MPEHERNKSCDEEFKRHDREFETYRGKFDKIFEDRLPHMQNCIKESATRCHERIDDIEIRKVNMRMFQWITATVISLVIAMVVGSVRYTYSQADAYANITQKAVEELKIVDKEAQMDRKRISDAQIKVVTTLENINKNIEKILKKIEK